MARPKGSGNKKPSPRPGRSANKLTPKQEKTAETVDCPSKSRPGHGKDCLLCGGSGEIKAHK